MDPEQDAQFEDLDDVLGAHEYPTTTDDLRGAYGDRTVETQDGSSTLKDVLEAVDGESYDSADDVRDRIQDLINR